MHNPNPTPVYEKAFDEFLKDRLEKYTKDDNEILIKHARKLHDLMDAEECITVLFYEDDPTPALFICPLTNRVPDEEAFQTTLERMVKADFTNQEIFEITGIEKGDSCKGLPVTDGYIMKNRPVRTERTAICLYDTMGWIEHCIRPLGLDPGVISLLASAVTYIQDQPNPYRYFNMLDTMLGSLSPAHTDMLFCLYFHFEDGCSETLDIMTKSGNRFRADVTYNGDYAEAGISYLPKGYEPYEAMDLAYVSFQDGELHLRMFADIPSEDATNEAVINEKDILEALHNLEV